VFAQAQLHFPAVAQMVGLRLRNWKMLYLSAGIDRHFSPPYRGSSRSSATLSHYSYVSLQSPKIWYSRFLTVCVIPANCAWLRPDLTIDGFWRKPAIRQAYDLGSHCPGFEPTAPRVEKLEP
jgi:hypothetical protein